jgi:starch synthase
MKVLFCSSEAVPFAKTGGLADVSSALPDELRNQGIDCSVVMPLYGRIRDTGISLEHVSDISFLSGQGIGTGRIFTCGHTYFIENDTYFDRGGMYSYGAKDFPDNLERFAFYSRACIELLQIIGGVDIVHCNDWQSALVLPYMQSLGIEGISTLFTIHNLAYQGSFDVSLWPLLLLPQEYLHPDVMEFFGRINVMKAGIVLADMVNTVSPTYALEIQTSEFGSGLDGLLRSVSYKLKGITNGIDSTIWNPRTDRLIAKTYSADDISGKDLCKKDLQKRFSLTPGDHPIFGMIGRLVEQKGIDLVIDIIPELIDSGSQIVILGNGLTQYEHLLEKMSSAHKGQLGVHIGFDESLAHIIEAGSDFFLMPSKFEPCGLNQLISMRYGTIPIVTGVGGLKDTVETLGEGEHPTGIRVSTPRTDALLAAVNQALSIFSRRKSVFEIIRINAMKKNVDWQASAREYSRLYDKMMEF